MPSRSEYHSFNSTGPVNVVRTSPREMRGRRIVIYILMGPTGSGKSAFIESLSHEPLSISKDTLESVTQEVVGYRVDNLRSRRDHTLRIMLMDTPGFLDTKLSESRIATMIRRELYKFRRCASSVVVGIIYLHPITDIRLGASKRDVARLLMAFARLFDVNAIIVATTMWNTIHTPRKVADAEDRLVALRADIFKSSGNMTISPHKFEFSRESVLRIMDNVHLMVFFPPKEYDSSQFQSMACDNLLNRIHQAETQLQILTEDHIHATTSGTEDHELLEMIDESQKTVTAALNSFLNDLYDLDPTVYRSNLPSHPFPPPPPPRRSFLNDLQQVMRRLPFKSVFKKQ